MLKILSLAILGLLVKGIIFDLKGRGDKACFVIRSEHSREFVNFSYVIFSRAIGGNKIHFELRHRTTGILEKEVLPDEMNNQRIFKFENDQKSVYNACFINPDEHKKQIKFYVDHRNKVNIAEKNSFMGANRFTKLLEEQAGKLQNKMFEIYLSSKQTEEAFSNSQSVFRTATIFKFGLLLTVTIIQTVMVTKLVVNRVSFSHYI